MREARGYDMRRMMGVGLIIVGLAPIVAFLAWWSHQYVVGIDLDLRAALFLGTFALLDAACIWYAFHLIRGSGRN